jgi:RHS repeat-associated protein
VYKVPAGGLETDRNKLTLGRREYELTNHLGNVLATVSDLKLPAAKVLSHTDYYAFGSAMAGRTGTPGGANYRYGFNGKENDRDFGNAQLIQDYGFRIYNPAIGKFLSVDPLAQSFPWNSVYAFAENSPILFKDLDGLERIHYQRTFENGKPVFTFLREADFEETTLNPRFSSEAGFQVYNKATNPRLEYVVHQEREGTIERFDKVQFVTYEETWTYSSFEDMVSDRNGIQGSEHLNFVLAKSISVMAEAGRDAGAGGGGLDWTRAITRSSKKVATNAVKSILSGRYTGKLVKVSKADADADALATKLGGQSRVKFENDPTGREFDVVSDKYIAQTKSIGQLGSKFRNQAKATFEAAKESGREVYFQFTGGKAPSEIIDKLKEYSTRYGVKLTIDN